MVKRQAAEDMDRIRFYASTRALWIGWAVGAFAGVFVLVVNGASLGGVTPFTCFLGLGLVEIVARAKKSR